LPAKNITNSNTPEVGTKQETITKARKTAQKNMLITSPKKLMLRNISHPGVVKRWVPLKRWVPP